MKKILKCPLVWIVCSFVIIGLSVFVVLHLTQSTTWFDGQGQNDAYEFPITPAGNPDKWKEFQTYQEMLDACQIPEKKLKVMTTEGLIETCINYPMALNFMLSDSFVLGYNSVCENFNGLQELYARNDCVEKILDFFNSINIKNLKDVKNASLIYRFCCMLCSQDNIISRLDSEQQNKLINTLDLHIKDIRKNYKDFYSENAPLFAKFKILKIKYQEFNKLLKDNLYLKYFSETGVWGGITIEDKEDLLRQINNIKK